VATFALHSIRSLVDAIDSIRNASVRQDKGTDSGLQPQNSKSLDPACPPQTTFIFLLTTTYPDVVQHYIGLSRIGPYNSLNSRAPRTRSGALGSHKFYIYLLGIPEIIPFLGFLIYYIFFALIRLYSTLI
jgi:hypothetical protein